MRGDEQLLREIKDLRKRLKETEETLRDLQSREEALRKSEQEKSTILNSLSEEVTYLDRNMKVLWTNRTACESAGLGPEQLTGCYCYDVWCRNGEPRTDCPAARTVRTGQQEQGEISIPDGRTFLQRSYPTRDAKGNIVGTVVITLDITEHKQAEKVLRESENAYRTLAESLPGMVYRVFIRENNRMDFLNGMLQPMTGYRAEELAAGRVCSIESLILTQDREAVVAVVERAILDQQPFEVEYRLRHKEGETRNFLERGRPIYGEDGKPLYIDGIILDITARKVAEEALKKTDSEKTVILNATVEAMALLDKNLKLIWANRVCAERIGRPSQQLAGRYCYEIWANRREPCVGCPTLKTIEAGRMEQAEIVTSDGKTWFHRSYPVQDANGHIENIVSTALDITERKQHEEKLWEHAQVLDQIHDSVISTDLDGYVVTWNKGAERIFGYSAEEALGKHISFVYPPDQHEFLQHEVIEPLKKRGLYEIEVKMRRKSNEDFYAHLSLSLLKNKGDLEIGMIGSSVDLTERIRLEEQLRRSRDELELRVQERTKKLREEIAQRKQAEEALKESENRFVLFMKHLPGSAFIKDREGTILYVNEYVEKMYNCKVEDFLGKTGKDFWPPELAARIREDDDHVISTGGTIERIEEVEHGGKWIPFLTFKFPIFRPGLPPLIGGISIDITERKRAEEALRESEKRLRFLSSQLITAQEQERKRVASELHDGLGSALSGIKFKVETILHQRGENKLKAIEKQLESVVPMIQEVIREVRRIQTDLRPATLDSLGVLATIRGACRRFQTIYPPISIQEEEDIQEEEIPAWLKIVIYRIFQEALNNVGKHSRADLVNLSLRKRDGKTELVIQDNGRGFDVNEALSRSSSIRGLGLTSMRERAELSGGSFTVESTVGKGTIVRVSWPAIQVAKGSAS